jgi:hypothetical protein
MAVGDIVSVTFTSSQDYQPAAGVVLCVTWLIASDTANYMYGRGGMATTPEIQMGDTAGGSAANLGYWNQGGSNKIFIDNTSYIGLYTTAAAKQVGFSAIQIQ